MAQDYAFADHMFQTNQGPTFPAHQYIISGSSSIRDHSELVVEDNPGHKSESKNGGCHSQPNSVAPVININNGKLREEIFPCFERITLMDLLTARSPDHSWTYYQQEAGSGLTHAPAAIRHIFQQSSL